MPQGFRDSTRLFGQVLAKDLAAFHATESIKVVQYVDGILLCADTDNKCDQAICDLSLNYLAPCGYEISKSKVQMCQQEVKYSGLKHSRGVQTLGKERMESILQHPLPNTLRQLHGFLDITSYSCIWIPRWRIRTKGITVGTWRNTCIQDFKRGSSSGSCSQPACAVALVVSDSVQPHGL